jgi:hypothetical protein
MIQFFQPVGTLLIGVALSLYGLIHSANHFPGPTHLHTLWQSLPALSAVLLFALGAMAVICGLALLFVGVQGLRRRYRQINSAFGRPVEFDDEVDYRPPAYR